ncbi:YifB family Mg chelatase-like AAA ATPase [Corynebacterium sp. H113]|uniref:YifB family Mg chelatase-like AAA ATPase n=1 Tax=Corynebacterium sp. H113 TaxID=3133419 RepID=UPI003097DE13
MAVGRAVSVALNGIDGTIVHVEADVGHGLPGMHIGGLGDAAVSEARERVRTAATNSGIAWPRTKIVVSMSPASLRKHGSIFDVSIVCAVLAASTKDEEAQERLDHTVVLGEVGLDGSVRGVDGVLPAVLVAKEAGYRTIVVPEANAVEAAMVEDMTVGCVGSLSQLWHWVRTGEGQLSVAKDIEEQRLDLPDMADVHGQDEARCALEVAAAGGHHLFLMGPPGTGKSMLAERLPGILPELTKEQALETMAVRSVLGQVAPDSLGVRHQPPFVAPHHTVTPAALIGGGVHPQPGALSRAHHGVLFLDEVSLMSPRALDTLRTPLELGEIVLMRARQQIRYPCRVQLVMAANPCGCGAQDAENCRCSAHARKRHLTPLSGPLRDRIDLNIAVHPRHAVITPELGEPSTAIRERVTIARERARQRWQGIEGIDDLRTIASNADVPGPLLRRYAPATDDAMAYLEALLSSGDINQRGIDRSLRVAWTLADLAGTSQPTIDEVAHAVDLHDSGKELVPA